MWPVAGPGARRDERARGVCAAHRADGHAVHRRDLCARPQRAARRAAPGRLGSGRHHFQQQRRRRGTASASGWRPRGRQQARRCRRLRRHLVHLRGRHLRHRHGKRHISCLATCAGWKSRALTCAWAGLAGQLLRPGAAGQLRSQLHEPRRPLQRPRRRWRWRRPLSSQQRSQLCNETLLDDLTAFTAAPARQLLP